MQTGNELIALVATTFCVSCPKITIPSVKTGIQAWSKLFVEIINKALLQKTISGPKGKDELPVNN